jgi:hypothetical protein
MEYSKEYIEDGMALNAFDEISRYLLVNLILHYKSTIKKK